ncbi:MAG: type II secretion system protein [Clostridia bacterium]|nr:type II secretion system protein [Clostridia bacterium]
MKNKKGISLIVLVITIIVMIILAAAVIISMNNTGIIDKASHVVKLTDEKQVQDLASMLWAEAYLDETRTDTIENVVKQGLNEQGVTTENWNIDVSDTGVTVTKKQDVAANLIDFVVQYDAGNFESVTYQAEQGMTWSQWINSKYNVDGWRLDSITEENGSITRIDNPFVQDGKTQYDLFGIYEAVPNELIVSNKIYQYGYCGHVYE